MCSRNGAKYRDECLVHGGGKPSPKLVSDFLGKDMGAELLTDALVEEIDRKNQKVEKVRDRLGVVYVSFVENHQGNVNDLSEISFSDIKRIFRPSSYWLLLPLAVLHWSIKQCFENDFMPEKLGNGFLSKIFFLKNILLNLVIPIS